MWRWLTLIFLLPVVAIAAYVAFTPHRTDMTILLVVAAVLVGGIAAVWATPWQQRAKIALSLGYVPIMGGALLMTAFATDCSAHGCL